LEKEEALADIEAENRLKDENEASSSSSDKDRKKERNVFNDEDITSISNSNKSSE